MKSYQKAQKSVKESVKVLNEEALLETAAEGLLSQSMGRPKRGFYTAF